MDWCQIRLASRPAKFIAGHASSGIWYCQIALAGQQKTLAGRMARVDWYVQIYIYIHMYIYKITHCGLLAVKPVVDMIEQMVGVQCYHNNKMGYTTTRRPILLVEVKETQISLKILIITDVFKVFSDKITAILSVIIYHKTGNNICFLPFQMGHKQNKLMSIFWVHYGLMSPHRYFDVPES